MDAIKNFVDSNRNLTKQEKAELKACLHSVNVPELRRALELYSIACANRVKVEDPSYELGKRDVLISLKLLLARDKED